MPMKKDGKSVNKKAKTSVSIAKHYIVDSASLFIEKKSFKL